MENLPVTPDAIAHDIQVVGQVGSVPAILQLICQTTGMGFSAVARVTDESWTACAVHDNVSFGLKAGGQLDLKTTLCYESRAARQPIVIDDFDVHPLYRGHHTSRIYGLRSYISVPIELPDGTYFGNLCAIDPKPASVSNSQTLAMFESFAKLIAFQLSNADRQQTIEEALSREREVASLREQFIAVLGHDLRNPLSAVSATAELLTLRREDPRLVTMGQRLKATTQRMANLIDDVMDFARGRLGSGIGLTLRPEDDLGSALIAVIGELRQANAECDVIDEILIDQTVHCDIVRVQQLLSNLLGNALTHGAPNASVFVRASIHQETLILSVSNSGDLIAPETMQKVFEPYWRPPSSVPGGGLGLGLYICKQIVEAHNGTLEVCSSVENGTCFTARIPSAPIR